jgi:hypothetical protein
MNWEGNIDVLGGEKKCIENFENLQAGNPRLRWRP